MSSGEDSREEDFASVNLEHVKRISETYKPRKGTGKDKRGAIAKSVVQDIWKDRLTPRFYSRLMSVMFPEDSNEVSFLSFYTIYKNLAEPETEIMFRALTIYHIATIHEPPFNYEQANEYPNASYKAIKDYVCDVITSYLHAIIQFNMKEAFAWLELRASNTMIDGNLVASYMLKDLETHRNEVSIGSLEIWLEKNEMYYTVSEQLYLYLFGVNSYRDVKPLIPLPIVQTGKATKTLLALPDLLLLNSKLPKRAQRWTLAYMLDSRSQNWETLKNAVYGKSQTIIVIQDANGDIFGMYGSQRWFPSEGFFGNNECFLFTLKPDVNIYEGSGRDNNFQLFTETGIGIGGTPERMGLFIQSNLLQGSSSLTCSTFREFWPLARELEFKITQIEIWAVDDEQAQSVVEPDPVGKPTPNRQYTSTKCCAVYNEHTKEQATNKQSPDVPGPVFYCVPETSMATYGPVQRCLGECAKRCQPINDPNCSPGNACCAKHCTMKTRVSGSRNTPRGEGDENAKVRSVQRYPRQEEERLQCQHRYSKDKVRIIRVNRRHRISFDARQKGVAAGFIHPSLAAEENARNKQAAAEENARNVKAAGEENARRGKTAKQVSPAFIKTSTSIKSKQQRSSTERALSQKSKSPTFTHTRTQVGESRIVERTIKCACNVKNSCACSNASAKAPSSSKNQKPYKIKENHTSCSRIEEQQKTNEFNPDQTIKPSPHMTEHQSYLSGMPAESSSTILIELNNRNFGVSPKMEKENLTKIVPPVNKASDMKAEPKEKASDSKQKDEPNNAASKKILAYPTRSAETNEDLKQQYLTQTGLDCRCSNSSNCNDAEEEINKNNPNSLCGCQTKLTSYMTRTHREDVADIPLNEISSSVCSCILDHKNKVTSSVGEISNDLSKKETQILTKSRRKSSESGRPTGKTAAYSKKECTRSHISSFSPKNETPIFNKAKRVSSTLPSTAYSDEGPKQVLPTCLKCRASVGQQGYQCKSKCVPRSKVTPTLLQTSNPEQEDLNWDPLALKGIESGRSVVIDNNAPSYIFDVDQMEQDKKSLSESSTLSNIDKVSSRSSEIEQPPKKLCKTGCNCSLSPSYFPAFPEDLIKEGGTVDDCDCASYNLRFPIIVDTPPELNTEPSLGLRSTSGSSMDFDEAKMREEGGSGGGRRGGSAAAAGGEGGGRGGKKGSAAAPGGGTGGGGAAGEEGEEYEGEIKDNKRECDDNDNTIIILNVSKCNTAETVEKIIQELELKAGNASNPNSGSFVFRSKDLANSPQFTLPCTAKGSSEREALRQHIEEILKIKNLTNPI